jgi:hypothetical protein
MPWRNSLQFFLLVQVDQHLKDWHQYQVNREKKVIVDYQAPLDPQDFKYDLCVMNYSIVLIEFSTGFKWFTRITWITRIERRIRTTRYSRPSRTKRHHRYEKNQEFLIVKMTLFCLFFRLSWRTRYFCSFQHLRIWEKKQYLFNIGIPGRDGSSGVPGPKGFGKYPYNRFW